MSNQFQRTHSVLFLRCIELWTKAVLSSDRAFFKHIVVLRDREEWSPETWAKPSKNEQHIGSIKELRPPKNSNKLTFKPQRTANQYAAKRRIYKRPEQQKYTLSRHTEFCKGDRTTWKLTFRDEPQKGRNGCLRLRPRSVFGSFGVVLMSCKVNFHVVRSALKNSVCLLRVYFCWSGLLWILRFAAYSFAVLRCLNVK